MSQCWLYKIRETFSVKTTFLCVLLVLQYWFCAESVRGPRLVRRKIQSIQSMLRAFYCWFLERFKKLYFIYCGFGRFNWQSFSQLPAWIFFLWMPSTTYHRWLELWHYIYSFAQSGKAIKVNWNKHSHTHTRTTHTHIIQM